MEIWERVESLSFVTLTGGNIQLTAFKQHEDRNGSYTVRVFNPESKPTTAKLTFAKPIRKAWLRKLNEERRKKLKPTSKSLSIPLTRKKIAAIGLMICSHHNGICSARPPCRAFFLYEPKTTAVSHRYAFARVVRGAPENRLVLPDFPAKSKSSPFKRRGTRRRWEVLSNRPVDSDTCKCIRTADAPVGFSEVLSVETQIFP
ncbi:MAG: hypothetical protein HUU46_24105 [Candidatus Hydrogenedentes bacterium]|nr:hypothetical protein [Candidatus Hydrogenedentota bacterium]